MLLRQHVVPLVATILGSWRILDFSQRLMQSRCFVQNHQYYSEVIMCVMASQISIVYSKICSGTDQRKHQSSASLAYVRGIHRGPLNSPHKGPVTRKLFPFDDVITNTGAINIDNISAIWRRCLPTNIAVVHIGHSFQESRPVRWGKPTPQAHGGHRNINMSPNSNQTFLLINRGFIMEFYLWEWPLCLTLDFRCFHKRFPIISEMQK